MRQHPQMLSTQVKNHRSSPGSAADALRASVSLYIPPDTAGVQLPEVQRWAPCRSTKAGPVSESKLTPTPGHTIPAPRMSSSIPCSEKAYPLRGKPPSPPRMDLRCSAFSAPGAQGGPREEAGTGPVPSARHLHSLDSSTDLIQDHHLVLDPATPATAKHHAAEAELTTGAGARVLKRHMDAVLKVFATHSYPNHELPWQVGRWRDGVVDHWGWGLVHWCRAGVGQSVC